MEEPIEAVKGIYGAFGRGDIPSILSALAPDIEWVNPGPDDLSYFGVRRGRDAVQQLFEYVGGEFELAQFEPKLFFAEGETVAVVLQMKGRMRSTGKEFEQDLAHIFSFGDDGLVTNFLDIQNTAAVADALRP